MPLNAVSSGRCLKGPMRGADLTGVTQSIAALGPAPRPGVAAPMRWWARALHWLPRGRSLPAEAWAGRHRGVLWLLVLHVPAILAFAVIQNPNDVTQALI